MADTETPSPTSIRRFVIAFIAIALAALAPTIDPVAGDFDDSAIFSVDYPDWFNEPDFLDLQDDLSSAQMQGKRGLMLFFTTQGCSYCYRFLNTSLADEAIVERLRAHFDVVGLEIFSDTELTAPDGETMPVKAFAKREGVQFAPSLLFYGAGGEPLLRVTGYYEPERFARVLEYLIGGSHSDRSFADWERDRLATERERRESQPLLSNPLFASPPYALERSRSPADRPLLVIFEQPGCQRCPGFHAEVLQDPDIAGMLAELEVVRLDASDSSTPVITPDGTRSSSAAWSRALGFNEYPALAFFDVHGRQIIATDALVLKSRMTNLLGLVADKAYARGWSYQRYARTKSLERASARDAK